MAVESVVLAWKIHWAPVLPSASRVKAAAENSNVPVAEQYVPGVRTKPARSALWRVWFAEHVALEAWLYRVARLAAQLLASGLLCSSVPALISYEPPMALPGDTPTEPVVTTVFAPLKLTEVPARTAKYAHSPSTNGTSVVDMLAADIILALLEDKIGRVTDEALSKEIAVKAKARPEIADWVPKVMAVLAKIEPAKLLEYPRVALVPRAQKIFSAFAPFCRMISVDDAVVKAVLT